MFLHADVPIKISKKSRRLSFVLEEIRNKIDNLSFNVK
jgi:hypothetical protein